jgi:hypothetical protein
MSKAKLQTRQLRTINGIYPSLRVGIQAYFSPELNFAVSDPDEYEEGAEDIEFDVRAAIQDYYSCVLGSSQIARVPRLILGREYLFRAIEEIGVSIGIDTETLKRLEQHSDLKDALANEPSHAVIGDDEQGTVVFADGLAVSLDQRWSEDRMRRDPRSRQDG